MGFFKKLGAEWKAMNRYEKFNFVIDLVAHMGAGFAGLKVGRKLTEGSGKLETICVRTFTTGVAIAAGDKAGKALMLTPEQIDRAVKQDEERAKKEALKREREAETNG